MPVSAFPSPGDRIGRFRIVSQLGQGGMGVVFSALEENLNRKVALKVISPQYAHDADFRERFAREARALAALDSTHVVTVYAHGEEDGYLYIAAQLIPDGDLSQMLQASGPAPVRQAMRLMEQVAAGLADAHEVGLIHRDIKPGNVLIRRKDNTIQGYLGDFGIAKTADSNLTQVGGSAIGTPAYMAPELHRGVEASRATDIYSLGCLLWVTLTGKAPYPGQTEYEIITGHMQAPIPQLPGRDPLSAEANRILRTAMAKNPAERYPSAAAMRSDLANAINLPDGGSPERFANSGGAQAYQVRTPTPSGGLTNHPPRGAATQPAYAMAAQPPAPAKKSKAGLYLGLGGGLAAAAVLGVVLVLTLGGDDFSKGTAEEIVTTAEKDMKVLDSVHVKGSFDQDGATSQVDMDITARGACEGTFAYGAGGIAEVVGEDGEFWIRPDEEFWRASAGEGADAVIAAVGDKWVAVGTDDIESFEGLCDLDELLEGDGDEGESTPKNAGKDTINGQEVVKVTTEKDGDTTTTYVAVDDPHYVIRLQNPAGDFTFSDFDLDVNVDAPTDDEVADLGSTS